MRLAPRLLQLYAADRWEHAVALFVYFHGRACSAMDVVRFLEDDCRMAPEDHLLAHRSGDQLTIVGVNVPGCVILDSAEGPADWAIGKASGAGMARRIRRRKVVALDMMEVSG